MKHINVLANLVGNAAKYILSTLIVIIITLFIVDVIITQSERNGCERRQRIFRIIKEVAETTANSREKIAEFATNPKAKKLILNEVFLLRKESKKIDKYIVRDCNEAYPKTIPFIH